MVATASGGPTSPVQRKWDGAGKLMNTDEFLAEGGWIEERVLNLGDISVIVPSPNETDSVYFHGIEASSDLTFWTMGTKN